VQHNLVAFPKILVPSNQYIKLHSNPNWLMQINKGFGSVYPFLFDRYAMWVLLVIALLLLLVGAPTLYGLSYTFIVVVPLFVFFIPDWFIASVNFMSLEL
jgi:hypothetical protein